MIESICKLNHLPMPVREYKFHPDRKWRIDFAWPSHKLAIEIEGGVWTRGRHIRGKGFLNDMEKYNELARMGWCLFRFTPQDQGKAERFLVDFFEMNKKRNGQVKKEGL